MSFVARYVSSILSRLSLFALPDSATPVTPRTPQSTTSSPGIPCLARGLILSTNPYLKGAAANPKVSLTPAAADTASCSFDVSLSSDTSTSSSYSDLITPLRSIDTNDLFSPRCLVQFNSSFPHTPSPSHLVGLGISGVPRRDGKSGDFDGLGLVGIRRSFNPRNPFLGPSDDDDDDDGYASPTPARVHRRSAEKHDEQEEDGELSEAFMRALVFTWESDPQHTRALTTIPECDDEYQVESQRDVFEKEVDTSPVSSPQSTLSSRSSPSTLQTPSPLTLHIATQPRVTQALKHTTKSGLSISSASSRHSHSHSRSKSCPHSTSAPTPGRTPTRAKNPSGLTSGRDDSATAASSRKKLAAKGAWRT
ncbi:hypothetical protein C0989_001035 [Termitomyces sp. Mn162]|nr:hypothetical protein C0989_001035 [Termitomyces sp. Mn162]